jgi:hypothetical protein
MGCVHVCETKERILKNPFVFRHLFDPVAGNRKVAICVARLPRITRQIDLAINYFALGEN